MADLATTPQPCLLAESILDKKMNKACPHGSVSPLVLAALVGWPRLHRLACHAGPRQHPHGQHWPYVLLGLALLIALGFEFVNGFHDTANAVATVIYTHSLDPNVAVVWSGTVQPGRRAGFDTARLPSPSSPASGRAYSQVSSGAGFAMVFALLIAAILWNLGTWWFGLPASSSHTMVGSIIGVGLANQLMNALSGTSGVDWDQAAKVFQGAADLACRRLCCAPSCCFCSPSGSSIPRTLPGAQRQHASTVAYPRAADLHLHRCQLFHGSNDGQKGMGLIMLILIGTVPTAYALNHAVTPHDMQQFIASSEKAGAILDRMSTKTAFWAAMPAPKSPTTSRPSSCSRNNARPA